MNNILLCLPIGVYDTMLSLGVLLALYKPLDFVFSLGDILLWFSYDYFVQNSDNLIVADVDINCNSSFQSANKS